MQIKRVALYTALAVFNLYVLWPAPSASRVYRNRANSVVKVERFESPVVSMELGPITLAIKLPFGRYGHGSGVIISKKGHILTAKHVADGSGLFMITTKGGSVYEAGVLSLDSRNDLAILQPVRGSPRGFSVASLATQATVGENVVHIGCPLSFEWLLTQGVVSLLGKNMLVSDAVINPGSSGGALFSLSGKLVGITIGLISPGNFYVGHSICVGPEEINRFVNTSLL
jgi:S1-C subfamily serine protease